MRRRLCNLCALALALVIAPTSMAADLSSPERALKALEDAYVRKDIEAAVAAKDFQFEARAMLGALKNLPGPPDDQLVQQAAEVLELSFRQQMKTSGFPAFAGLQCGVVRKKQLRADLVQLVEECIFPDGGKSTGTLHAARSAAGWRIVVLP